MRIFWHSVLVTMAASSLACSSGDPVSIGKDDQTPTAKTGESLADYGGAWDGYLEGAMFAFDSDRVRVTLNDSGEGTLEVGDVPLIDPPTDRDQGYPPDTHDLTSGFDQKLHDGFRYTLRNAKVESRRIQLQIEWAEIYEAWCELQASYLQTTDPEPVYGCIPPSPDGKLSTSHDRCFLGDVDNPERVEITCTQKSECQGGGGACACTEDSCTSNGETARILDAALESDGDELVGTLIGWGTVRLTRQ